MAGRQSLQVECFTFSSDYWVVYNYKFRFVFQDFSVKAGSNNLDTSTSPITVKNIYQHPDYPANTDRDIALLVIDPLVLTANVAVIPIFYKNVEAGDHLRGYGHSCLIAGTITCQLAILPPVESVVIPRELRWADMDVISNSAGPCDRPSENREKFCTYSNPLGIGSPKGSACSVSLLLVYFLNLQRTVNYLDNVFHFILN